MRIFKKRGIILKIIAVGDIIGTSGVKELKNRLKKIKEEEKIDFTIVNGENSAEGMGITEKNFKDILEAGADVITMGNHTWAKKDIFEFINNPIIIRPANYSEGVPGHGYGIYECKGKKIAVIDLIGRTDMGILSENPFLVVDKIINKISDKVDIIIVDFHAEATAEKIAMKYHLDWRVNFVFGTHTHVQTADEEVTGKGTAYITDLGMTGPKNSVIGMDTEASLKRFITSLQERYKLANGDCILCGAIIDINDECCRTENIDRIYLK